LIDNGWELTRIEQALKTNLVALDKSLGHEEDAVLEEARLQLFLKGASLLGDRLAKRRKMQ
jgi:hypothetical protein